MHALGIALLALAPQTIHLDLPPPEPAESTFSTEWMRSPIEMGDVDGDGVPDFLCGFWRTVDGLLNGDPGAKVYSGATREILHSFHFDTDAAYYTRIDVIGDVDQDGVADVLSGHPGHPFSGGAEGIYQNGRASVWSGRTGLLIRSHDGVNEGLGGAVRGIDDINGDGVADYAISSPSWSANRGRVRVHSGADGTVLHTKTGAAQTEAHLGGRLGYAGDLNGDGSPDLLASDGALGGGVVAYSPINNTVFREHIPPPSGWYFNISGLDDLDGDGVDEYVVVSRFEDVVGPGGTLLEDAGVVRVFNGATGQLAYFVHGEADDRLDGGTSTPDANGDGYRDFFVVTSYTNGNFRVLQLRSGFTGAILKTWTAKAITASIWGTVLPDLDADGSAELAIYHRALTGPTALEHGYVEYLESLHSTVPHETLSPRFGQRSGASLALAHLNIDQVVDTVVGAPHVDLTGLDHGVVRAISGVGAVEIWSVEGAQGIQLGASLAAIGDVDQDGVQDIAIGAPRDYKTGIGDVLQRPGRVYVVSGATGAEIYNRWSWTSGERFGAMLANVGDVDDDGIDDFVAGCPDYLPFGQTAPLGRAHLYSSASGIPLHTWTGSTAGGRLGHAGAGVGDVNADGVPDVALGVPGRDTVQVRSGADGELLWSYTNSAYPRLGWSLAGIGDIDGDGTPDVAAGSPGPFDNVADDGFVFFLSGLDGSQIALVRGMPGERFGASLAPAGDVDLDGVPDIAVGAPDHFEPVVGPILGNSAGRVVIVSGANPGLAPLREWSGDTAFGRFGLVLGGRGLPVDDYDYDGISDLAAASPTQADDAGRVQALSARAQDTYPFGLGTPGCGGEHRLVLSQRPVIGATTHLRADAGSASSVGVRLVSLGADTLGTDFGLGFLFHVDVTDLFAIEAAVVGPLGIVETPVPVPNNANLVGVEIMMQMILAGPAGACAALPGPYSSTPGLRLVIGE